MGAYSYQSKNIRVYLQGLYAQGLKTSNHLTNTEVEEILTNIGIFKFKGYYFAFRDNPSRHSIDDILLVYFFDKFLTRIIMDLTSSIETKLKTTLVELCYEKIRNLPKSDGNKNNPFFYLFDRNHKKIIDKNGRVVIDYKTKKPKQFKINSATEGNWKIKNLHHANQAESYRHYGLYYTNKYDRPSNKAKYLKREKLIHTYNDINYPPFHYLIESATLGGVNSLIKSLKIGSYDLLQATAKEFNVQNAHSFGPYLDRLNEVRNRAAHRERIFNRSFRSISRFGRFSSLSHSLNNHKFLDVYLYFFFMLNRIDKFSSIQAFKSDEVERLFKNFRKDYYLRKDSKMLTKKIKKSEFDKIKDFIKRGMT